MPLYNNRFVGALPAGDVFNFGWWATGSGDVNAMNNAASGWIADFWGVVGGDYNAGTVVNNCISYAIDETSHRATAIAELPQSLPGTGSGNPLPQQVSVLASLRTSNPARSGRGRFFLPAPAVSVLSPTGEMSTAARDLFVGAIESAWNSQVIAAGFTPVVWSRKAGATYTITKVGVGTVFDTQTRRTNKLTTDRNFVNP